MISMPKVFFFSKIGIVLLFKGCMLPKLHEVFDLQTLQQKKKTSSARSATLANTSRARLILQLGPSFSVDRLQAATCQILNFAWSPKQSRVWQRHRTMYIGRRDTAHTFLMQGIDWEGENIYWQGGYRTYFVDRGNNWGGDTAQH